MEQSIWDMTHYRIRDLAQFGEESEDPIGILVGNPENKNWALAIDSMDENIPPVPSQYGLVEIGGREYVTVKIGNVEWMAENLDWQFPGLEYKDATHPLVPPASYHDEGIMQAAYYQYNEAEYGYRGKKYGLMYSGKAITYLQTHLEELGVPDGWRIPVGTELQILKSYAGSDASKLKSESWDGTDDYGFNAMPCGQCISSVGDMYFMGMNDSTVIGSYASSSGAATVAMLGIELISSSTRMDTIALAYNDCRYIRLVRPIVPPTPPTDKYYGKRISMERITVLGPQGKIPAVNLPSYISYCAECEVVYSLPAWGNMNKVYCLKEDGKADRFYRWVEDASAEFPSPKTGSFVPIVCNYKMKSGTGTTISDSLDSGYTRQVDLTITAPGSPEANVLSSEVATGLSHTKSGLGDSGAVFPSGQITTGSNFGDSVYVQNVTCNATGHVTALTETAVTYPSTAASVTTPGIVEIAMPDSVQDSPARSHIQPITGAEHSSPGTITPPAGEYVYLAPADHVHSAATLTFANLRDSTGAVNIEYNMAHDVTFNMKDVLHILPPTSIPTGDMMLVSTMLSGGTAIWDDFPTTARKCTSNGHSFVVVGTNTSLITNQSSPFQVIENTLYSVTATIQVKITEGIGLNSPANVPKCYVCIIDIGGVTRKFNIPGSYTFSLPYTLNVNCLYKAGASSTSDHMVNVDVKATLDDNIFSACCVEAKAVELI